MRPATSTGGLSSPMAAIEPERSLISIAYMKVVMMARISGARRERVVNVEGMWPLRGWLSWAFGEAEHASVLMSGIKMSSMGASGGGSSAWGANDEEMRMITRVNHRMAAMYSISCD